MSSLYIVIAIVALLTILVGYAYIHQKLEKRRKQRQRLIAALKLRQRGFKEMLASFPAGFLTKDLTLVLYRALIDASEQLSRLEPRQASHLEEFNLYSKELEALKQKELSRGGRLDKPEQIAEARRQLQELHHFIVQQAERGNIGRNQALAYNEQIKRLVLQMSVDAHVMNAKQAQQAGKSRLAMHYYGLARKLLVRENAGHSYQKQIIQLNGIIAKLEGQAEQQAPAEEAPRKSEAAATPLESKEWEQFGEDEEKWKKKQVYD